MCKSIELTKNLLDDIQAINNHFHSNRDKLSKLDKQIDKVLHTIESEKFNEHQGYIHALDLQNLTRERRKLKKEMKLLNSLHHRLNNNNINEKVIRSIFNNVRKTYNKQLKDLEKYHK